jgi:hypothetical protein
VSLDWLSQDLADLFARDSRARVALWCDGRGEFRDIAPDANGGPARVPQG